MNYLKYTIGTLFCLAFYFGGYSQLSFIEWGSTLGAEEDYGVLTNTTTSSDYGFSGGLSTNLLEQSGTGIIELPEMLPPFTEYAVGLVPASINFSFSIAEADFAIERTSSGIVVHFNGQTETFIGNWSNDKLLIKVNNGEAYVTDVSGTPLPGTVAYQISTTSYYHICALVKIGGESIAGLRTDIQNLFKVEWEDWTTGLVDVTTNQDVSKISGTNAWNEAAAFSTNRLKPGEDGFIELTVETLVGQRAFGLISSQVNLSYNGMDYGLRIVGMTTSNNIPYNTIGFYRNGNLLGSHSPVLEGDVLRIERQGTLLRIRLNGVSFPTTVNVDPAEELQAMVAFKEINNSSISTLHASFVPPSILSRDFVRLVNSDDPEHIPVTQILKTDDFGFIYKEIYEFQDVLDVRLYDDNYIDVTSLVVFNTDIARYGENKVTMDIEDLNEGEKYHLEVKDGMKRKWQMNFYVKN